MSRGRATLLLPALVVVGGGIGTGKSTIAGALASLMNAPCIEADQARRSVVGASPATHLNADTWESAYDPSITRSIYEKVLRRADQVLSAGRPVVIDASFRSRALRSAVRALAERHKVPFRFVECRADLALCHARLSERTKLNEGPDANDPGGRASMIDAFLAAFEPIRELAETEHIALDTSAPLEEVLGHLKERLASWPPKFVA